jgi:hypothetical protein
MSSNLSTGKKKKGEEEKSRVRGGQPRMRSCLEKRQWEVARFQLDGESCLACTSLWV